MIIKVFWKKSFRSRKISSGQFDFSVVYGTENCAEFWKNFSQSTSKNSPFFSKMFFFEKAFGDVEISYDKLDEKSLPKAEFFCSTLQIDFEKRFFWKLFRKDPMDT